MSSRLTYKKVLSPSLIIFNDVLYLSIAKILFFVFFAFGGRNKYFTICNLYKKPPQSYVIIREGNTPDKINVSISKVRYSLVFVFIRLSLSTSEIALRVSKSTFLFVKSGVLKE